MPYNNGIVFIDTTTTPNEGVSIQDVKQALGRSTGDLGLLCSDQEWYDTGQTDQQGNAVYALRNAGCINPFALWKPFRNSAKYFVDATAQRTAIQAENGGFKQANGLLPTYSANGGTAGQIPHAAWTYKPPRGVGGGYDEPFRLTDFAPLSGGVGYYSRAVNPVGIMWPDKWRSDNLVVVLLNGNNPNWLRDLCLSFSDIIPSGSSVGYGDYNFGLILSSSSGRDLILSTYTPNGIANTGAASFSFSKSDVTALSGLSAGSKCTAAICLYRPSTAITQQTIYHIPTDLNPDVISLEIVTDSDRAEIEMGHDGSIAGLVVTMSNLVLSTPSIPPAYASQSWLYDCKQVNLNPNALSIIVNASGCSSWGQLGNTIMGSIEFLCEGAILGNQQGIIGGSVTYPFAPTVNPSTQYSGSFVFGNTFPGTTVPYELYLCKTAQSATQKLKARVTFSYDTTVYSNGGSYLEVTI